MSNNTSFENEFGATPEMQVELPETEQTAEAAEKTTYKLNDGTEGSRAAFIREKFLEDNMSRKEISEQFGFPYRVVYSATVNLVNDAEGTTRGRSAQNSVIKVTADNKLVIEADGKIYVQGEEVADMPETFDKARNEWIKEQVEAGVERGVVAKLLDLSYGVIYNITKEETGTRDKHMVTLEDGTEITRSEYIRQLFAAGKDRGDIAKELDVPYSVVWQATKVKKTVQEKFNDAVEVLKGFADKVEDAEAFAIIMADLAAVTMKAEAEATEAATEEAAE